MNENLVLGNPSKRRYGGTTGSNGDRPRPSGTAATGRIVKLLVGQGHGFIRLSDAREIYFHRGDLSEGTPFNAFQVGDTVAFELLEDRFSGARALHVRRQESC